MDIRNITKKSEVGYANYNSSLAPRVVGTSIAKPTETGFAPGLAHLLINQVEQNIGYKGQGLHYINHWMTNYAPGENIIEPPTPASKFTKYNVKLSKLRQYTKNINDHCNMTNGVDDLFYGHLRFGCQGTSARALALGAGIYTLPINFLPSILQAQLVIRQALIYSSPILINN